MVFQVLKGLEQGLARVLKVVLNQTKHYFIGVTAVAKHNPGNQDKHSVYKVTTATA